MPPVANANGTIMSSADSSSGGQTITGHELRECKRAKTESRLSSAFLWRLLTEIFAPFA